MRTHRATRVWLKWIGSHLVNDGSEKPSPNIRLGIIKQREVSQVTSSYDRLNRGKHWARTCMAESTKFLPNICSLFCIRLFLCLWLYFLSFVSGARCSQLAVYRLYRTELECTRILVLLLYYYHHFPWKRRLHSLFAIVNCNSVFHIIHICSASEFLETENRHTPTRARHVLYCAHNCGFTFRAQSVAGEHIDDLLKI